MGRDIGYTSSKAALNMERLGKSRPTVIVFTNYMLPEYQRLASLLGVEYFLNKSRDYERLPEIIQEIGASQPAH